ncbi:urease accessory protein UreE [Marinivivus vitaminiproducens]|uniref:urease accessory protein UreE n=1 Tax=Marinivivus vitaminiproducens TaxID=3035935 RepID=UPI00279F411C|nr:urease accessory protein UreE [Geminicoccaceae bacterium SCSIO 64248]
MTEPHTATHHHPEGAWPAAERAGSLTLTHEDRHVRRKRLTTDQGEPVLLDLPQAVTLRTGDGLRLEGGGWLEIRAADEDVLQITADSPAALVRLAWHLGNRHTPTQLGTDWLRVAYDHVLEPMLQGLGGRTERRQAPFQPESGAYAGHEHPHRHHHGQDEANEPVKGRRYRYDPQHGHGN